MQYIMNIDVLRSRAESRAELPQIPDDIYPISSKVSLRQGQHVFWPSCHHPHVRTHATRKKSKQKSILNWIVNNKLRPQRAVLDTLCGLINSFINFKKSRYDFIVYFVNMSTWCFSLHSSSCFKHKYLTNEICYTIM